MTSTKLFRAALGLLLSLSLLLGAAGTGSAGHSDPNEIHACMRDDKFIRFVPDPAECSSNEKAMTWNVRGEKGDLGPQGERGETGPAGRDGEDGQPGMDGATWYTGSGAPGAGLGSEGDLYFDTTSGDVYLKSADGWAGPISNLKGPKGDQGEPGDDGDDGAPGAPGKDGATWHSGSGVPGAELGSDGDFYLDGSNGDVFRKVSGAWGKIANIKGPQGDPGGVALPPSGIGSRAISYSKAPKQDMTPATSIDAGSTLLPTGTWSVWARAQLNGTVGGCSLLFDGVGIPGDGGHTVSVAEIPREPAANALLSTMMQAVSLSEPTRARVRCFVNGFPGRTSVSNVRILAVEIGSVMYREEF